jgi:hypothetical protein
MPQLDAALAARLRGDSIGSLDSLPALEEEQALPPPPQSSNARRGAALS